MATADLLLHPIRLRIVQALLGGRELTTADLGARVRDVPTATLYRHVATLLDAGLLEVVAERRVRGTYERTFRLADPAPSVGAEEAAAMSRDAHQQAFLSFTAGLLADFDRYLARDDYDLGRDLVGYRQTALDLTDDELRELLEDLARAVRKRSGLPPAAGRRRRLLTTIVMPDDD